MSKKTGRNDPCPCGSGKKYKTCCLNKPPLSRKKITANVVTKSVNPIDLMERQFSKGIALGKQEFKPVESQDGANREETPQKGSQEGSGENPVVL